MIKYKPQRKKNTINLNYKT